MFHFYTYTCSYLFSAWDVNICFDNDSNCLFTNSLQYDQDSVPYSTDILERFNIIEK